MSLHLNKLWTFFLAILCLSYKYRTYIVCLFHFCLASADKADIVLVMDDSWSVSVSVCFKQLMDQFGYNVEQQYCLCYKF